jgi:hypothetical protein
MCEWWTSTEFRAEPTEKAISAGLWGGQSHPQDLEADVIQSFSLPVSFLY